MIYLDNAATTMQKPPEVLRAMRTAFNSFGGAGRGAHLPAMNAAGAIYDMREAACELFGAPSPENVVLTCNATHALNIAIKSLATGKVLVSGLEHNAVMRPLHALESSGVSYTVVETSLFDPSMTLQKFWEALDSSVSLVVCTHVSNVFGAVLPIVELSRLCRDKHVPLIVDASQSAGVIPINMSSMPGTVLCMPGHKALYGPQGTGLLIVPKELERKMMPLMEGGTGSNSLHFSMPFDLPDALEAGTHNAWGAAGLLEGIRFVRRKKPENIDSRERKLLHELASLLENRKRIKCFYHPQHQTGVLSLAFEGADVEDVAAILSDYDIAVRAGLQCAALAHITAGTLPTGTLRVSFSAFSTSGEIRTFATKLIDIMKRL